MDQQNKLFVGSLDYSVTTDELRELFAQFGEVTDCIVLVDKMTGRSKGFGFVSFATAEQADAAIAAMNEFDHKGRKLNVSKARPPRPREERGFGGGGGRGGFSSGGGGNRRFSNQRSY
jgi:RNA recognition motif-containing protein